MTTIKVEGTTVQRKTDMSATELIRRIEKLVAQMKREGTGRPNAGWTADVEASHAEWSALLRFVRIGKLAEHYVDVRTNHPQAAGEMWRELCAEIDREA